MEHSSTEKKGRQEQLDKAWERLSLHITGRLATETYRDEYCTPEAIRKHVALTYDDASGTIALTRWDLPFGGFAPLPDKETALLLGIATIALDILAAKAAYDQRWKWVEPRSLWRCIVL